MKRFQKLLPLLTVLVVGLLSAPRIAEGQSCGTSCISCEGAPSPDYKTGAGTMGHERHKLFCTQGNCATCSIADQFATRRGERPDAMASRLRASQPSEFARIASQHRSELRLDRNRRLLVVLGGCDGRAVVSVVALNPGQLATLEKIEIASLASHYENLRSRPTLAVASAR